MARMAAVGACWVACTQAAAGTLQPGMWEMLSQSNVGGTRAQAPATRVCVSAKDAQESLQDLPRPAPGCTVQNVKSSGNRTSYAIACPVNPAMHGQVELTATPEAYEGTMQMTITQAPGAPEVPMSVTFAGRRLGDC